MDFGPVTNYLTGVLVPVSALHTERSEGIGEFADLPELAGWCRTCGLDLIQILPVNDTGDNSSPYSARSAFALHPVYLRLADLPEVAGGATPDHLVAEIDQTVAELREHAEQCRRVHYRDVYNAKEQLLAKIYAACEPVIATDAELQQWTDASPWIHEYAAYRGWTENPDGPTEADPSVVRYYAWVQFRLEQQFLLAACGVAEQGVRLKGDIPILITEHSADVWARPEIFLPELRAGAPPDMFSRLGQNWDLPIYNWDEQARRDYRWWKDRLAQAAKFYHAYRIDHVLGFFRVWSIPANDASGTLGWFVPSRTLTVEDLSGIGFDRGRIRWLAEPHLSGAMLRQALETPIDDLVPTILEQIPNEDLYLFSSQVTGERDLLGASLPEGDRAWLAEQYRDRALIITLDGRYAPAWTFRDCSRYQELSDGEREAFEQLVARVGAESEAMWEEHGRRLLRFMVDSTDMLPCAEDLGVIPDSVPRVLAELGIMGLRIPRWSRRWNEPGQPFVRPSAYPFLTVCAPSVHDTSTIAGWWRENDSRDLFYQMLQLGDTAPATYDVATAVRVTRGILQARSAIVVLQVQDLLALASGAWRREDAQDRVNVPGTVNDENWSYRIPVPISVLRDSRELNQVVGELCDERRRRPLPAVHT